jgi:hypothetical protein
VRAGPNLGKSPGRLDHHLAKKYRSMIVIRLNDKYERETETHLEPLHQLLLAESWRQQALL